MIGWAAPVILALLFFKIGAASFGGAYTIWALVHENFASGDGHMAAGLAPLPEEQIQSFMQIAHLTPGPNINGVLLIGEHYLGLPGILLAFVSLLLPSVFSMLFLYRINQRLAGFSWFSSFKKGALAAVVGILVFFFIDLSTKIPQFKSTLGILFFVQAAVVLYLVRYRRLNGVLVTFLSGLLTWAGSTMFL